LIIEVEEQNWKTDEEHEEVEG